MNATTLPQSRVLIVDDEEPIRRMLQLPLKRSGYACLHASSGAEALDLLSRETVEVVITDICMPEMDGIELTEIIRAKYDPDVIMMTGYVKDLTYEEAIASGASDFIQKPIDMKEISIRLKRVLRERHMRFELQKALQRSQQILEGLIQALSSTVEAKDPYTSGHQRRVAELAGTIASHMGLSDEQVTAIRMSGVIHDLGKIAIPSAILSKPSRLSSIEFELLQTHAQVGYEILKNISFPWPIAEIVYQHHERMDGTGYPRGLKGDEILIESRILAVADVVEAMSSHRPYRPALGIDAALGEISGRKGMLYDSDTVDACLQVVRGTGFSFAPADIHSADRLSN